ncbi:MAG: nickel-dependent hydrogenase large subunit [Deltaproteobacteria bacterium]|jgi:[NiFe] hydrogenase large subunit|nr:nickel-dependent hydrogenase large subunit [Deltaproteobacteria bacterium]
MFTGPIVIDPLTRVEGHLRIEVEVDNGRVKNARSTATLFRGIETILRGRDPRDAQHFAQRTCGVCTYVHGLASIRALEDALGLSIPENATLIRNLVLGAQYLHDHIVHFYHLHALDFVDVSAALQADPAKAAKLAASIANPTSADTLRAVQNKLKAFAEGGQLGIFTNAYSWGGHPAYYLDPESNLLLTAHYLEALRLQMKAAQAMAVFGGKNPHPQFLIAGGVTCYNSLAPERLKEFETLFRQVLEFVEQTYIPDLLFVARAYKDWAGIGGTRNFMTFGEFPDDERKLESRAFKPGIVLDQNVNRVLPFDPEKIEEHVRHSWYDGETARAPFAGETDPSFTFMGDTDRYSWSKAPRYDGLAMETGPLAQVLISYLQQDPDIQPLVRTVLHELSMPLDALFSTLGRTAARGIETLAIARKMERWLATLRDRISSGDTRLAADWTMPASAKGAGFLTAPRGGLSHWLVIEDKKIANYQLVVPPTWNLGPRCAKGIPSAVEEALQGTPVADPERPVEILRTVHSFDPCLACAVHVIDGHSDKTRVFKVL